MRLSCLFVSLCLLAHNGIACLCIPLKPLNAEIFKRYQYVALVRVKTLEQFTPPGLDPKNTELTKFTKNSELAKFRVDVIENFKNPLPAELILDGYNTSCDIDLRPNQEWIIFAKESNGYPTVFPCDYSIPYERGRAVRNISQLRFRSGDELLNTIRQLTGKPIRVENDRLEKFYSSGQRALLSTYHQGGREEERIVWHENGRLWGKEYYKNGLKNGLSLWWNENGTPNARETFVAGIPIDTSRHWYNTDTDTLWLQSTPTLTEHARDSILQFNKRSHIQSVTIADRQGRLLNDRRYDWNGRLVDETIGVPEAGVECRTSYDKQGNINFLIVTRTVPSSGYEPTNHLVYRIDYEKDGSRQIAHYDNKGRLTRWVSVRNGVETVLEEKHYPD